MKATMKHFKKSPKIKLKSKSRKVFTGTVAVVFGLIGVAVIRLSQAAPGLCSTTGVLGTSTYTVTAPETAQYRLWVRMQVPDAVNTNNTNGVKIELAGSSNQCFTVTTTNPSAVNQWMWVNSDATSSSTPHVTSQMTNGNYSTKLLGLKAGVKVDKVILLRSDNTCIPSNDFTNGAPGDNCTTPAPGISLTANPTSVVNGNASSLSWTTSNATSCTASGGWTGARGTTGTNVTTGNLTSTQTYTLTCAGVGGSTSASTTVTVTTPPVPTLTLTGNPTSVVSGSASILTWASTNATNCAGSGSWTDSNLGTSGSRSTGSLTSNSSFIVTCTGAGGSVSRTQAISVTVSPPPADTTPPVVVTSIPGITVTPGQTTATVNNLKDLTWRPLASDASGITSLVVTVNGQPATLNASGEVRVGVGSNGRTQNGDYILTAVATDSSGNTTTSTILIKLRHPDFDRSGTVGNADLTQLLRNWGTTSTIYDIGGETRVGNYDLTFLLRQWNSTL